MNQTAVNGNSKDRPINIVDQKKLDNSIMIMTQYNSSGMAPNNLVQNHINTTAISKALA